MSLWVHIGEVYASIYMSLSAKIQRSKIFQDHSIGHALQI
jgi:hypothetical protein